MEDSLAAEESMHQVERVSLVPKMTARMKKEILEKEKTEKKESYKAAARDWANGVFPSVR